MTSSIGPKSLGTPSSPSRRTSWMRSRGCAPRRPGNLHSTKEQQVVVEPASADGHDDANDYPDRAHRSASRLRADIRPWGRVRALALPRLSALLLVPAGIRGRCRTVLVLGGLCRWGRALGQLQLAGVTSISTSIDTASSPRSIGQISGTPGSTTRSIAGARRTGIAESQAALWPEGPGGRADAGSVSRPCRAGTRKAWRARRNLGGQGQRFEGRHGQGLGQTREAGPFPAWGMVPKHGPTAIAALQAAAVGVDFPVTVGVLGAVGVDFPGVAGLFTRRGGRGRR